MGVRTCLFIAMGLLSACEVTDSQRVQAACASLCECEAPGLPALQDRCIAECMQDVDIQLSDDCLACITTHDTCSTLERDCEPICSQPEPPVFDETNP